MLWGCEGTDGDVYGAKKTVKLPPAVCEAIITICASSTSNLILYTMQAHLHNLRVPYSQQTSLLLNIIAPFFFKSIWSHCSRGVVEGWELTDRREGINGWTKEKGEREREEDERREGSKTSLAGSRAHIQEERFVHMPERHQTSADLPCRSVSMTTLSPGKLAWQQRGGERSGGGSERREGREGGGEEKKKKKEGKCE